MKLNKILISLFLILFFINGALKAQDPPQYGTPFQGVPNVQDINMYQVHIRPFSQNGDLDGVTARLDNIKNLGINVIYLMPVFPHGEDQRSTSSPYCIKDFKSVASEYGTLNDLRELVDGAHQRGIAVILDVAINGTSWDHPWITEHPEYYGSSIEQLGNFGDVAALDLEHSGTRAAIIDALRYWIFEANIDGYRCDYANNPSVDFWTEVISNLRSINSHDLLMLAEGDRQENFNAGFDMIFGFNWFYNALKNVSEGGPVNERFNTANDIEYAMAAGNQEVVRFTGNHDTYTNENGADRPFEVFNNHDGVVANLLVSAYMKGVPFLMSGQEIDYEPMTPWPWEGFKFDWTSNPGASVDFSNILNFRLSSEAVRRGDLTDYSNTDVCAFTKISGDEKVVVIANLRNYSTSYSLPDPLGGTYQNAFTGEEVMLNSGGTRDLAAYEYFVLKNAEGATTINNSVDVKFKNTGNWDEVYVYSWSPELFGAWPGQLLTDIGDGWHSVDFDGSESPNLIFNNNVEQAADIVGNVSACYEYAGADVQPIAVDCSAVNVPLAMGESENDLFEILISPNPATEAIRINAIGQNNELFNVRVLNISGVAVYAADFKSDEVIVISRDGLTAGTYFVEIRSLNSNFREIKKIVFNNF
jgi:glycosidase